MIDSKILFSFIFLLTIALQAIHLESIDNEFTKGLPQKDNHEIQGLQPVPLNGFSPSPKCWQNAITLFHSERTIQDLKDLESLCASMPETYQKLLALEIASCHLQDLGKELYRDEGLREVCMNSDTFNGGYDRKLAVCLKQLTATGENSYTVYITYVQNMCIRLTQELLLRHLQESQQIALSRYFEASEQSVKNMMAIKDISQLHIDQINQLSSIPSKVSKQLSTDLGDQVQDLIQTSLEKALSKHLSGHVKETFDESIRSLTVKQANDHNVIIETIMERVESRDAENQERFQEWSEYLVSLWQRQAIAMDQHQVKIQEHSRQMENLDEAVRSTTDSMNSLSRIQKMVFVAVVGYRWTSSLLYLACTITVTRLLTKLLSCKGRIVYLLAIVEFLLELLCSADVRYSDTNEWTKNLCIPTLRRWATAIELLTLTGSAIAKVFVEHTSKPLSPRQQGNYGYVQFGNMHHRPIVFPHGSYSGIITPPTMSYANKPQTVNFQNVHSTVRYATDQSNDDSTQLIDVKKHSQASSNLSGNNRSQTAKNTPLIGITSPSTSSNGRGSTSKIQSPDTAYVNVFTDNTHMNSGSDIVGQYTPTYDTENNPNDITMSSTVDFDDIDQMRYIQCESCETQCAQTELNHTALLTAKRLADSDIERLVAMKRLKQMR
jgi:hypothetical protein